MAEPLKLFSQVVNSNLGCQESSGSIAAWECDLLQGDFLTGPPLNLLSVGWKVTDFKNIARIANAVQVTICLLVSTSVY